jgi:hypothetical protein
MSQSYHTTRAYPGAAWSRHATSCTSCSSTWLISWAEGQFGLAKVTVLRGDRAEAHRLAKVLVGIGQTFLSFSTYHTN